MASRMAHLPSLASSSASMIIFISSGRLTSNCIAVTPPYVPQIFGLESNEERGVEFIVRNNNTDQARDLCSP